MSPLSSLRPSLDDEFDQLMAELDEDDFENPREDFGAMRRSLPAAPIAPAPTFGASCGCQQTSQAPTFGASCGCQKTAPAPAFGAACGCQTTACKREEAFGADIAVWRDGEPPNTFWESAKVGAGVATGFLGVVVVANVVAKALR